MNERIKELALQAYQYAFDESKADPDACVLGGSYFLMIKERKFAELIVAECKENFTKVWYEQGLDIQGAELDKFLTRFEKHLGVEE